ncbi:MAG: hypothetical protein N2689_11800 [Verrucomicrobiae bacterium]|nr:hypothetical protein [Verrucomicrobiae bacterium]
MRITLPPRPVAPGASAQAPTQAAPAVPPRPAGTIPAIPVPPKKQTAPLKKTTGKVPGATKPAMPVVPPPTVRQQAVPPAPTTMPAAPPSTVPGASPVRPTVKLQTVDIPASRPQQAVFPTEGRAQPAPIASERSGPTAVDAVLSLLVVAMGCVLAWQLWSVLHM